MILRICFSVVDSKANVFAPSALPRGPHLGPPPLDITDRDRALRERRELAAKLEAAQREERRRIARDIMTSWCNFWQLWPSTSAVSLLIRLTRHEAPVDKRERFSARLCELQRWLGASLTDCIRRNRTTWD